MKLKLDQNVIVRFNKQKINALQCSVIKGGDGETTTAEEEDIVIVDFVSI